MDWSVIPEPLLVSILKHLETPQVLRAGRVCSHWYNVCQDNQLWKHLFHRDFKCPPSTLRTPDSNWHDEYIRLVDRVPCVSHQTLHEHNDEVLHVAFSHSGRTFASCSKDSKVIVWGLDDKCKAHLVFTYEFSTWFWRHTWAAQYSPNDVHLMVAGTSNDIGGEVAIFGISDDENSYSFICRIVNDPYDVLGCWINDQHFVAGTIFSDFFAHLEATLWLCKPHKREDNTSDPPHLEEVIFADQMEIRTYLNILYRLENSAGSVYIRYVQCHHRKKVIENVDDEAALWTESTLRRSHYKEFLGAPQSYDPAIDTMFNDLCLIFMCGDKTTIPHQIGFQRITAEDLRRPLRSELPDVTLDCHGHVVGFVLSPDERQLLVNVRPWPENAVPTFDQPPAIAAQIELRVIDMKTLQWTHKIYTGHLGYTPSERAFYLYLGVSTDYVSSGSEDGSGRIWDRHYRTCVAQLRHSECVNCVSICPRDQEVCVSASDDNTLRISISKNRARSLASSD